MILAVNTAQVIHELALINGEKILSQRAWPDKRDDLEKLIPTLQEMLEELGLKKSEIKAIVVCKGPGHYTAVRTGVTFANALAEGLSAKLYEMDTFELLKRKVATTDPVLVVTNAGGIDIGMFFDGGIAGADGGIKVGSISNLLAPIHHGMVKVVSELKDELAEELHGICLEKGWEEIPEEKLQTLGEVILTFGLEALRQTDNVEPYYLKDPNVTQSENPWKKP